MNRRIGDHLCFHVIYAALHTCNIPHGARISGMLHCITEAKNDVSITETRSKVSVLSYFLSSE